MTTVWTVWAQRAREDKLSLMSTSEPEGPAKADRFLKEFLQRLDLGEFDGRLHEVLKDLTHEELMKVAEHLATRHP